MKFLILAAISFTSSWAQECTTTLSPQEFMNKALETDIHLELKSKEVQAKDGFIWHAKRFYNPDFEHFTTQGSQFGQLNVTSESRIWFHLQLGNKRQKKADVVIAEKEMSQVELDLLKLKLRKDYFLALLRLKQVKFEHHSVQSLLKLIDDFIDRYKSVTHLSAEQRVEKGSLEMSHNELYLTEAKLRNEYQSILRFFQEALRETCKVEITIPEVIPKNNWPLMQAVAFNVDASLSYKLAELAVKRSEFELVKEDAHKWPDLKLGPVWQLNRLGDKEYNIFGAALIIPIPIFDRNQGLREVASINVNRAKIEADFKRTQIRKEYDYRRENYINLKNRYFKVNELNKYDTQLVEYRSLFRRGLITIPNFLAYKREFIMFTEKLHSMEQILGDHLYMLYQINNENMGEIVPKVLNI